MAATVRIPLIQVTIGAIGAMIGSIWQFITTYAWKIAVAVVLAAFVLIWIRPFDPPVPPQQNVGALWSNSIAALGIQPIYPPQEDFYVGDIYAVISASDEEQGKTREKSPNGPLALKSFRIGHINLRNLDMTPPGAPVFATTKMDDDKRTASLVQERDEVAMSPTGRIRVSLVSFPAMESSDDNNAGGAFLDNFSLSASRRSHHDDTLAITTAETYGASSIESILALNNWCSDEKTKLFCTDAFARRVLGYIVDNQVLQVRDNKYVYRLDIKLVTQVYLTRVINYRHNSNGSISGLLGEGTKPAPAAAPAENANKPDKPSGDAPAGVVAENGVNFGRSGETTMTIGNVTYPRPVAFGFKSVTFALVPSVPEAAPTP